MSWWHSDIDTWAGTDGTDLYKPYVDLVNAVHERRESLGFTPLILSYNTKGEAVSEPVYGTKAAPLEYKDVLGIPLNGQFYYMCIALSGYVTALYPGTLSGHSLGARWAKPDWNGGGPDGLDYTGVWYGVTIEEELGSLIDNLPADFFVTHSVFHLPAYFKYFRRVIELLQYPIRTFGVESGMTWPEDWEPVTSTQILGQEPTTLIDAAPIDIGTIYNYEFHWVNIGVGLYSTTPTPHTSNGYNWAGAFASHQSTEQTVPPADALSDTYASAFLWGPENPIPRHRVYPPTGIYKEVTGPSVSPYEMKIIAIPPESRGEYPNNHDRGPVVNSMAKRCSARGQQYAKLKITPDLLDLPGSILKEFMSFSISAKDCPVVGWTVEGCFISESDPAFLATLSIGFGRSRYYEMSGVLNAQHEKIVTMRHTEDVNVNPFNGVYDQWHTFNASDTVYILRERIIMTGLGYKSVNAPTGAFGLAYASLSVDYAFT